MLNNTVVKHTHAYTSASFFTILRIYELCIYEQFLNGQISNLLEFLEIFGQFFISYASETGDKLIFAFVLCSVASFSTVRKLVPPFYFDLFT